MIENYKMFSFVALSMLIGGAVSGAVSTQRAVNDTLMLCNQRPHECKFKYDIIMYEKEGRVPYADPTKVQPKPQPVKK
jgi:hypothetical protein